MRLALLAFSPSRALRASTRAASRTRALASSAYPPPVPLVHSPLFSAPVLPPGHRFPMGVFDAIHARLLRTGVVLPSQVHAPPPLDMALVTAVHCPAYVAAFCAGTLPPAAVRKLGLPWSPALVQRSLAEVSGTLLAARLALSRGLACSTAGGTHHAAFAHGAGFCALNDLAVTAAALLASGEASRVLICDLDVHQGDGTATLLASEPRAFTLSLQCAANAYPARAASTLDVELTAGTGDEAYAAALRGALPPALAAFRPDLVLYDAGVDVHGRDALGRLALTDGGLLRRDLFVLTACLGAGVPVAAVVGGGYDAGGDLEALAARHCMLHRAAAVAWARAGL